MIPSIGTRIPTFTGPAAPPPSAAPQAAAGDAVTISTAPTASRPPAAGAVSTTSAPQVGGLARVVYLAGEGLARLGLFGGLAVGAGIGLGAALALGGTGYALPLLGGALLGFEGADAQAAHQALQQGRQSPAFLERAQKNRSLTATTAGAHVLTLAAGAAAFGAGLGLVGGVPGMLTGVAGSLVLAGAVLFSAGKAEKAVLASS